MSFLKAEWRKLVLVNYSLDPIILKPYLPFQTELDLWEGKCYVSLVGFMFQNTKILGFKIPFHINFPEVNLRFYVRHFHEGEWRRGVVFIKEIVPKPAISWVANSLYGENYQTLPMDYHWAEGDQKRNVHYAWRHQSKWHTIRVIADLKNSPIAPNTEAHFITEHYFGYTQIDARKTYEYEVTHPSWEQYNVQNFEIKVDFGKVYGHEFAILNNQKPDSIMLAEGSKITVENKRLIQ